MKKFLAAVAFCLLSVVSALAQDDAVRTVLVRVVDVEGNPLADARLKLTFRNAWEVEERSSTTDDAGNGIVEFPANVERPTLFVSKKGFVPQARRWHRFGEEVPDHVNFLIEPGTTIGGEVQNMRGEPIEGAKVALEIRADAGRFYDDANLNMFLVTGSEAPKTDAHGKWTYDGVPANAQVKMSVSHPAYVGDSAGLFNVSYTRDSQQDLRDQTALAKLADGVRISGQVVDGDNRPMSGARVNARLAPPTHSASESVTTDSDGKFELPAGPKGSYEVVTFAKGFAPDFRTTEGGKDRPLTIKLVRGIPVRLRVVDSDEKPLRAVLSLQKHERVNPDLLYWPKTQVPFATDSEGVFEWENAPPGELKFSIFATWFESKEVTISVSDREKEIVVTLEREKVFSGRVLDKKTGKPIDRFLIVPVRPGSVLYRQRGIIGRDGKFELPMRFGEVFGQPQNGIAAQPYLYVEHAGHRSILTEKSYDLSNPKEEVVIEMIEAEPVSGTVIDPDGKPVRLATVAMNESSNGMFSLSKLNYGTVTTDAEGKFLIPAPPSDYALVVQSPAGFFQGSYSSKRLNVGELQLKSWAVVSGTLVDSEGKPVSNMKVFLQAPGFGMGAASLAMNTVTALDGTFRLERVPDVKCELYTIPNSVGPQTVAASQNISAKPGETIEVTLMIEKQPTWNDAPSRKE